MLIRAVSATVVGSSSLPYWREKSLSEVEIDLFLHVKCRLLKMMQSIKMMKIVAGRKISPKLQMKKLTFRR